jgi:hypothetical protein
MPEADGFPPLARISQEISHEDAIAELDTGDGTRPHSDVDVRIGGGKVARLKVDAETRSTGWRQPAIVDE